MPVSAPQEAPQEACQALHDTAIQGREMSNLSHLGLYLLVYGFCCGCVALRACLGNPRALGSGR